MCSGTGQTGQTQIKQDSKTAQPILTTTQQTDQTVQDPLFTGAQQIVQPNVSQPLDPNLQQTLPPGQIVPLIQQQPVVQPQGQIVPPIQQQPVNQQPAQQQTIQQQYASVTWEKELRQMGTVEAMKHASGSQTTLKKAVEKASETSEAIVKEFNLGKSVTGKSKWRREKAFEKKKKLYDGTAASDWRAKRDTQEWRQPDYHPETAELQTMKDVITQIMSFSDPLITFKNDEAFVESYTKHYQMLEDAGKLKAALEGKTQDDLEVVIAGQDIEKVRKKAESYTSIRNYYRAKMDIISSPFYMVLRKGDTIHMTLAGLTEAIEKCGEDRKELKQYLEAALNLKILEEEGILNDHNKKREFYSCEQCVRWRAQRDKQDWRKPEDAPSAGQLQGLFANLADSKDLIEKMLNCSTNFMNYTDDVAFLDHFEENYQLLEEFCGLKDVLSGKTQEELDQVMKDRNLEAIQNEVIKYLNIRNFYRAKMDIMSSPYFMVMSKSDTADLTIEQLKKEIQDCDRPERKLYLEASLKLRLLADHGIYHNTKGKGALRVETSDGMSKTHGAYLAVGTFDRDLDASLSVLEIGGTAKSEERLTTMSLNDQEDSYVTGVEERKSKAAFDTIQLMDIGVGVHARGRVTEAGAYLSTTDKKASGNVRMDVGEVQASGRIGVTLGANLEDILVVDIGAQANASATFARASGNASYETDTKAGTFGGGLSTSGEFLTAKGNAAAKVGRFEMEVDGKTETVNGIAAMAGAEASVLSGTASGHVTLFGVKIGLKATGHLLGVGAKAGGYISAGKMGLTLGATLGMGGNISLDFDASYWTDKLKEIVKKKIKDTFKGQ